MSYPSGWPRSRLEAIVSLVVFCVGLAIIVGIRIFNGVPSDPAASSNPPQVRSSTGMGVTARDEAACIRLAFDWAEFRASGTPSWSTGDDASLLTPSVRDAFASARAMSEARDRVLTGAGTTDQLRQATDRAVTSTIAGCGFDPQLSDRFDRR
jgi:hypothetical protein